MADKLLNVKRMSVVRPFVQAWILFSEKDLLYLYLRDEMGFGLQRGNLLLTQNGS